MGPTIHLGYEPVIGYTSARVNAGLHIGARTSREFEETVDKTKEAANQVIHNNDDSETCNDMTDASETSREENNSPEDYAPTPLKSGAAKVFEYIPGFGILPGIGRIMEAIKAEDDPILNRIGHIIRGIFAILGLGILYLIPDLIGTYKIHYDPSWQQPTF